MSRSRLTLKKAGVVLDFVPPPTKVNNLIFGRTWIDSPGEATLTNLTTGDKVVLYFQPCGWFGYGFLIAIYPFFSAFYVNYYKSPVNTSHAERVLSCLKSESSC